MIPARRILAGQASQKPRPDRPTDRQKVPSSYVGAQSQFLRFVLLIASWFSKVLWCRMWNRLQDYNRFPLKSDNFHFSENLSYDKFGLSENMSYDQVPNVTS